ncbi:MAG: BlaI/MecI/CopY family transcriptional regulator [Planctomycetaceae bacterium]
MPTGRLELGKRERQIAEAVYRLEEAAVADVRAELSDPPSYSAVRAMLGMLVRKKVLKQRRDGKRYLYRPATPVEKVSRSALANVLKTFFAGEPAKVMATLLDVSENLSLDDLDRMKKLIEQARKEKAS